MPAPKGRDFEQTRKQLESWLAARLRADGLEAGDVRVGELSGPGTTGFSSDTLMFDARWSEAGSPVERPLVARLKPGGMTVFPTYDIAKQFHIQRRLAGTDVPVVPMYWLEEDASFLGAPFYVMGRIEGRIPTDQPPYHAGGWVCDLAPAQRETLWWSGIENLARIQRLDWRALGLDFLERPGDTPQEAQVREYEDMFAWMGGQPKPLLERGLAWVRENAPGDEPVVLSWGDARVGNMIFDEAMQCVGVLDWEMAALGSPELDFAWFLFLDRHHHEGLGVERLEGFPSREASVARWQELTGFEAKHLFYYEVFAALRFGIIIARIAQQMIHYGVLPEDSTFETENPVAQLLAMLLEEAGG
jgi:aminoglycoside phosphotransferase (APT) family kinase protein